MGTTVSDDAGNRFELRTVYCPICDRNDGVLVGYRGGSRHRDGLGVTTPIVRCAGCGLLFANPFPFPVDPQRLYGDPEKCFATHDADAKVASYRQIITEMVADAGVERPSLLDVGSGWGEALHAAQLVGLTDVVGLELSTGCVTRRSDARRGHPARDGRATRGERRSDL